MEYNDACSSGNKSILSINIAYIESYRELVNKLEENGVSTEDLHGENIGKINDELVHFDIMKF